MVGLGSTALRYVAASEGVKLTSSPTFFVLAGFDENPA